jgi:hypothetical protein
VFLSLLLFNNGVSGQKSDLYQGLAVLPIVGNSPETGISVGFSSIINFKTVRTDSLRSSFFGLDLAFTQRKQRLLSCNYLISGPGNRFISRGGAEWSLFPELYWGIGHNSPGMASILYSSNRFNIELVHYIKTRKPGWYAGVQVHHASLWNAQSLNAETGEPDMGQLPGEIKAYRVWAFGLGATLDTRNQPLNTTRGHYWDWSILPHHGNLGTYIEISNDMRRYIPIDSSEKNVWAHRFMSSFNFGPTPFLELPVIGNETARGIYAGRWRDRCIYSYQTEIRKFFLPRWGLAAFGGLNIVTPNPIRLFVPKWNAGAGLRFQINRKEKYNIRLDAGFGSDKQRGIYLGIGEIF